MLTYHGSLLTNPDRKFDVMNKGEKFNKSPGLTKVRSEGCELWSTNVDGMMWFISGYDLVCVAAVTARRALQSSKLPNMGVKSIIVAARLEREEVIVGYSCRSVPRFCGLINHHGFRIKALSF